MWSSTVIVCIGAVTRHRDSKMPFKIKEAAEFKRNIATILWSFSLPIWSHSLTNLKSACKQMLIISFSIVLYWLGAENKNNFNIFFFLLIFWYIIEFWTLKWKILPKYKHILEVETIIKTILWAINKKLSDKIDNHIKMKTHRFMYVRLMF